MNIEEAMSYNPNVSDSDTIKGLSKAIGAMVLITAVLIAAANIFFGA